jgi:hypothetical protein
MTMHARLPLSAMATTCKFSLSERSRLSGMSASSDTAPVWPPLIASETVKFIVLKPV